MNTHCIAKLLFVTLLAVPIAACSGENNEQTKTDVASAPSTTTSDTHAHSDQSDGPLCAAHNVDATLCFICDASLRDPGRLWCRGHGRYEDRCFHCHPEIREANRLFCEEHGLYEDECFFCHPELKIKESSVDTPETESGSADAVALYCGEHNVPEVECGICQPTLADELRPGQGLKIRLPSTASERKARIVAKQAQQGPAQSGVHAVGELRFNQNRLANITPAADGIVRRIHVDLGHRVESGQPLAELSSPRIAEAKAELLKAAAEENVAAEALSREKDLFERGLVADQRIRDVEARYATARATLRAAEQMLLDLGFDRQGLDRIVAAQEASSTLELVAPFAGTVIERDAVIGNVVSVGDRMFAVADLSTLWLSLAVSEQAVSSVRVGQRVEIHSDALGQRVEGHVTWISSRINETTRMAELRAEVPNPDGKLRAGMFVDANIIVEERSATLLLPRDTVHHFGGKAFVFVRVAKDLYELRRVETVPASTRLTAVTAGLGASEPVAVEQSYLLKSEFQKSRLGAGCID